MMSFKLEKIRVIVNIEHNSYPRTLPIAKYVQAPFFEQEILNQRTHLTLICQCDGFLFNS